MTDTFLAETTALLERTPSVVLLVLGYVGIGILALRTPAPDQ